MVHCGCSTSSKQIGPKHASEWAYAPNTIKVHPLTRMRVPDNKDEEPFVVVHVAFLDGDGFSCRGVGELRVEVNSNENRMLDEELIDLRDSETNRNRFDPVTRTYQLHFGNLPKDLRSVNIRAYFSVVGNKELKSKQFRVVNHAPNELGVGE